MSTIVVAMTACSECNGSGEIGGMVQPETSFDPQDAYWGMVRCPQCEGTGEVPEEEEILEELDRMLDRRTGHQADLTVSVGLLKSIRDRIAAAENDYSDMRKFQRKYIEAEAVGWKTKNELIAALTPFVSAYQKQAEPIGDSDLYDEQPRSVHVTLGDCRKAERVLRENS